eukprot:Gb_33647 [translate_table: standard]
MWHLHSEMPPLQQQFRINVAELNTQIVKKIGPDRADKYFGQLTKLLSRKFNKVDFDKLYYSTIGKENIGLHNMKVHFRKCTAGQGAAAICAFAFWPGLKEELFPWQLFDTEKD